MQNHLFLISIIIVHSSHVYLFQVFYHFLQEVSLILLIIHFSQVFQPLEFYQVQQLYPSQLFLVSQVYQVFQVFVISLSVPIFLVYQFFQLSPFVVFQVSRVLLVSLAEVQSSRQSHFNSLSQSLLSSLFLSIQHFNLTFRHYF